MTISRSADKAGLTLIEVLVAVVVLSVGISAVLYGMHVSIRALGVARDILQTNLLLREKMSNAEGLSGKLTSGASARDTSYIKEADRNFVCDVQIDSLDGSDSAALRKISVNVRPEASDRKYSLTTCLRVAEEEPSP